MCDLCFHQSLVRIIIAKKEIPRLPSTRTPSLLLCCHIVPENLCFTISRLCGARAICRVQVKYPAPNLLREIVARSFSQRPSRDSYTNLLAALASQYFHFSIRYIGCYEDACQGDLQVETQPASNKAILMRRVAFDSGSASVDKGWRELKDSFKAMV